MNEVITRVCADVRSGDVFEFGLASTPVTSNSNHITLPLMILQHNYIPAINSKNRTKKGGN